MRLRHDFEESPSQEAVRIPTNAKDYPKEGVAELRRIHAPGINDTSTFSLFEELFEKIEIKLYDFVDGLKILLHLPKYGSHVGQLRIRVD